VGGPVGQPPALPRKEYGAKILAADYDGKALEGERRGAYVIIRFESEEIAVKFYNDPQYQPSLNL
jgi:uncharacterized protein (DUF1330 family)